MAYNSRRSNSQDCYVRFNSYGGTDKPAQSPYGNMAQQPDSGRQGLNSVPIPNDSQPQLGDNRFANVPPPPMPSPVAAQGGQQDHQPQLGTTRVIEFSSAELNELLSNPKHHYTREGKPTKVCVKVYTDWCGPCRTLKPKFDELSMQYNNVLFVCINGERLGPEISGHISVSAVPVIFTFHCGRKLNMIPGADIDRIQEAVHELATYTK